MEKMFKIILPKLKKKTSKKQEERKKRIILIILIILLFFLFMLTVKDRLLSKPTIPEITSSSDEWSNIKTVEIEKDAYSTGKIDYYLYCISATNSTSNCNWQVTKTKNVQVTLAGTSYIFFKAVDVNGHESSPSKPCVVNIDIDAPSIINVAKTVNETTIKLNVTAEDLESGIDKYYFKLDDNPYIESDTNEYNFENLTPNTEYTITVRVVDKAGNEKEITFKVKTNDIGALNNDQTNPTTPDKDNSNTNDNNSNNPSSPTNNTDNNNSEDPGNTDNNNGEDPNNDNPNNNEEPVDEIPEISLSDVPAKITYSDSYDLPTSYKFGPSGGSVNCSVDNIAGYTNTNTILPGDHVIVCTAKSNKGTSVSVSKNITVDVNVEPDEEWNGWIKMNLYYPENSTNWEWRLGSPSTIRTGNNNDSWEPYTGPITVKLDDVKNVYIRYNLKGKTITQTPEGSLLVDIEPESYSIYNTETTKVKINYSDDAEIKQYKINGNDWQDYTGEFEVPANTNISARAIKNTNIYDGDGNIINTQKEQGNDAVFISEKVPTGEYAVKTDNLWITINPESTMISHDATTKVTLNYTDNPIKVQYQLNGGLWIDYTVPFEVGPNTTINAAIFKDINTYSNLGNVMATNTQVMTASNYITESMPSSDPSAPDYSYTTEDYSLSITADKNALNKDEPANITINYPEDAIYKKYQTNNGDIVDYTGPFDVAANTLITAITSKTVNIVRSDGVIVSTTNRTKTANKYIYTEQMAPTDDYLAGPNIIESTENLTDSAVVTITTANKASKIYYQESNGNWNEYTAPFSVSQNEKIRAYYITADDGRTSDMTTFYVQNIKENTMPYVKISSNHDLSTLTNSEIITISGQDYDTLEYSFDGVIYKPYTEGITITNNCRIYAKGTNKYGITNPYLDITNIGTAPASPTPDELTISINPDPTANEVNGLVGKVNVSINYDSRASNKYYKIGSDGEWLSYTAPLELTSNSTIYAYATSTNGKGYANYKIDYLTTGISDPVISLDTTETAYKVKVSIDFDKNASTKQYKIGNTGTLTDYTEPFDVDSNTIIYAYNEDILGNVGKSTYIITNIIKQPTYSILDKGTYYILKLNYPVTANYKEYKWTTDGTWNQYDVEKGILLIKKENASKLIGVDGVKVTDDNDNEVLYTKDYYVVDQPLTQLMENLFMRWDPVLPNVPTFDIAPNAPSKKDLITITFDDYSVIKKYKLSYNDGTETDWMDYTKPLVIDKNNTIIYAYSITSSEEQSKTSSVQITNIDEIAPTITANADFTTPKRKLNVTLVGTDNLKLENVGYAKGEHDANYMANYATVITNNSAFTVTENGVYTIYAVDTVGNITVKTINITNIDITAPDITIYDKTASFGTTSTISIDYGDSTNKQYKVGTAGTYKDYTGDFSINTLDVYQYKNNDNTITIYAKGTDPAGNVREVSQVIYSLDVDVPAVPNINTNAILYPVLTEYGFSIGGKASIIYDTTRNDLENYYSIDGGTTWKLYAGPFENTSGTIMAKSIKKIDNLTLQTSKTVKVASDALNPTAYDNNTSTYDSIYSMTKYVVIDSSMSGKTIELIQNNGIYRKLFCYDASGKVILEKSDYDFQQASDYKLTIPSGTVKIGLNQYYSSISYNVFELKLYNIPVITSKYIYPTLSTNGMSNTYNDVGIAYFSTSVQKLYRINGGEWQNYTGNINLSIGDKIEAKGIDMYGTETVISSLTSNSASNALLPVAYDGNLSTYDGYRNMIKYVNIDSSLIGKIIDIYQNGVINRNIICYNSSGGIISQDISYTAQWATDYKLTIPTGTTKIGIQHISGDAVNMIYEVKPPVVVKSSSPSLFSSLFAVPAATGEKTFIASPDIIVSNSDLWSTSKDVSISYPSGYTNEYSLDGENWQAYTTSINLTEPTTIFARSLNGEEVISSSSYQITKIDTTKPTISLDGVPTSINLGTDYLLPTNYTVDNTKSSGKAVCTINDIAYTSTSALPLGKYDIKCTITTGAGVIANANKSVEVIQEKVVTETSPAPIDSTTLDTSTTNPPPTQPSSSTTPATEPSGTTSTPTKGDETNVTAN